MWIGLGRVGQLRVCTVQNLQLKRTIDVPCRGVSTLACLNGKVRINLSCSSVKSGLWCTQNLPHIPLCLISHHHISPISSTLSHVIVLWDKSIKITDYEKSSRFFCVLGLGWFETRSYLYIWFLDFHKRASLGCPLGRDTYHDCYQRSTSYHRVRQRGWKDCRMEIRLTEMEIIRNNPSFQWSWMLYTALFGVSVEFGDGRWILSWHYLHHLSMSREVLFIIVVINLIYSYFLSLSIILISASVVEIYFTPNFVGEIAFSIPRYLGYDEFFEWLSKRKWQKWNLICSIWCKYENICLFIYFRHLIVPARIWLFVSWTIPSDVLMILFEIVFGWELMHLTDLLVSFFIFYWGLLLYLLKSSAEYWCKSELKDWNK